MEVDEHPIDESAIPDFRPDQATIFPAGSYEVVMVLDTREIESKSSRDNFSEAIRSKGINVETRALRLGDVLWIARRRDGLGGEEDECVLDYVVERKRLDDLCHSIKDGRYTEQCVRLPSLEKRRADDSSD
jgi:crossover junction endonuclease MUS81